MAEFPALPLFTDAYLADTRHLTAEEHGAYLLLLMYAWRTRGCALRDDDRYLARVIGVSAYRWRRLKPVLMEFFTIEDGLWRQKKLTDVYRGVESRVQKNRMNGAKGGRARARRASATTSFREPAAGASDQATGTANASASAAAPARPDGVAMDRPMGEAVGQATKTKTRFQKEKQQLAAAAGLDADRMDGAEITGWTAAGATLDGDILPTIQRVRAREEARLGQAPSSLAYYTPAILEARDRRLRARKAGEDHAAHHPAAPEKQRFDRENPAHWRQFLGDADSRFRGDYLSRNWQIGPDHPDFLPTSLGPDPRASANTLIPVDVRAVYGPRWGWVAPDPLKTEKPTAKD